MNLQAELITRYKGRISLIKHNLASKTNELKYLETQNVHSESIQECTEFIVSSRVNEDDYGLVLSLTVYTGAIAAEFRLELEIHRGNGLLLFKSEYNFKSTDVNKASGIIEKIEIELNHAEEKIISTLMTEYKITI